MRCCATNSRGCSKDPLHRISKPITTPHTLSYSVPHTEANNIVVIVASTFKLLCFESYGRLFFNWHTHPGRTKKTRLMPSRALQMASSVYCFLNQALSRYTKAAVELTDHPNGQRALTGKNLVDAIAFTDHWLQVFRL